MGFKLKCFTFFVVISVIYGCQSDTKEASAVDNSNSKQLFTEIPAYKSKLIFNNKVYDSPQLNYFNFMHLYMGAGVSVGDINNDGLPDVYFNGNTEPNKLFLNKGDFIFEDITKKSNVAGGFGFFTGTTMADVNADGYLDLYVCKSGNFKDNTKKANLLYINNGDLTFTESAHTYGLADQGQSTQASFFDYDKDGDLDVYVVNTPVKFNLTGFAMSRSDLQKSNEYDDLGAQDRLYRNNGDNTFTDVTFQAGLLKDIGFGLSVSIGDVNNDNYPDIYVANDFVSPDNFYLNNGDGTFREVGRDILKHTSFYSMGSTLADMDNDNNLDLFVLDMSPEDNFRSKTTMGMTDRNEFNTLVDLGYNRQYMHNMFFLNNGNSSFSEVSQMCGVDKTDWSWTALCEDFDNDGLKDFYITNGMQREVTERDAAIKRRQVLKEKERRFTEQEMYDLLNAMPSKKMSNYAFKNEGNLKFSNTSKEWGIVTPSFSNGAAYADFDNDGDLDLVVNNVNDNAFLYKNNCSGSNYLRIKLNGSRLNPFGYGARVNIKVNGQNQMQELIPTKGYFSSSEPILHFGLGSSSRVDTIEIIWNDGKRQVLKNVKGNILKVLNYRDANKEMETGKEEKTIFSEVKNILSSTFTHKETIFDDFSKQVLLPHKLSEIGPFVSTGDINNDGRDDFYVGGAANQSGAIYIQNEDDKLELIEVPALENDAMYEDQGSVFFDANGDGKLDLYVVSGSYEFDENSKFHQDRLYLNFGNNIFKKSNSLLPKIRSSGSCVVASDFDNDGDQDLFIGGRVVPGKYPYAPKNYLLRNTGGKFIDISTDVKGFDNLGMTTDAAWVDYDADNDLDLIVVGEWTPISLFENEEGTLKYSNSELGLENTNGWWNKIVVDDIDNDGDIDFVAGNLGLNYKFKASVEKPFHIYCSDFDENNTYDIVLAKNYKDDLYPVRGRTCSSEQMPFVSDKFPTFREFASADIIDIYGDDINNALHFQAEEFRTCLFINDGKGKFKKEYLPIEAQISPSNGLIINDFNSDGYKDILLAGNLYQSEVETTRADAGIGCLLLGDEDGNFKSCGLENSGFFVNKDVKSLALLNRDSKPIIIVGNNNSNLQTFKLR